MKNKLIDLNNHMFAQLEKLSDESLQGDKLDVEINRTKAIASVAGHIISNAALAFQAQKAMTDGLMRSAPEMLGITNE